MKISSGASVIGILICLGSFSLMAQAVRIGGKSLRANGQPVQNFEYAGPCPVNLKFGWDLISKAPTTATYSFARNDAHATNPQSVNLPAAHRSVQVYDLINLGANTPRYDNYTGWVKILVNTPNKVEGMIHFTIHCH